MREQRNGSGLDGNISTVSITAALPLRGWLFFYFLTKTLTTDFYLSLTWSLFTEYFCQRVRNQWLLEWATGHGSKNLGLS